ncbi:MAG: TolC family protein [Gemmataceae bacterium]|nr:TolC family protein [Gemmata sp.]MDW8199450.1 TolC family protein [Gemmataceae bacterium]
MPRSARCLPDIVSAAMVILLVGPGCTRHHWRQRADQDVEGIITQKNIFPDWQVKNWHVYPDPRARFADPTNPDRPPYPPDDFAARTLSPNPQKPTKRSGVGRIEGYEYLAKLQQWDAENRAADRVARPPVVTADELRWAYQQRASQGGQSPRPVVPRPTFSELAWPLPECTDRPAVRHTLPTHTPGAWRPGPVEGKKDENTPVATTDRPSGTIIPPRGRDEFSPWSGSRRPPPTIVEDRQPVMVVAGEVDHNGQSVPAIAVMPLERNATAGAPERWPPPQPVDPAKPAGNDPVGQGGDGWPADGEPAADYLRALTTDQPAYRIRLEQAIELGLFNSREFQDRREDLFLAALPVSLARFNFAALAFFGEEVIRRSTGRELANGGERWQFTSDGSIRKLFPTGAQLLARLANQVVIDLSGDKPTTTVSNLTLSLVQPLLRDGGKAVTLEPLTLAERNLLYAIRSYARFRKIFFVAIAAGGNYTNNPYGLQGLSPNLGRGIGGNLTAPNIGYLTLLRLEAQINNQRRNVAALERLLRLYQAFREGGQQSPLQVGQVEVQLLLSRGNLLTGGGNNPGIREYLDALDNFKLQLGLPMTVHLELDDTPLRPIREQLARFDELFAQARAMELEAARFDPAEPVAAFRKRWLNLLTESPLVKGTQFAQDIEKRWATWGPAQLTEEQARTRLADLKAQRRKILDERVERELKKLPDPPGTAEKLATLNAEIDLGEFELAVREYEAQPWAKKEGRERQLLQENAFTRAFNAFYLVVLSAQNERLAGLYKKWPALPPLPVNGLNLLTASLDEAYAAGTQAALANRFDLMNARAQVVDAWRQITVTANSLQGVFDVRYDLNSTTPPGGNNPVAFSGDRTSHQLTFRADLPLVRRAERNNYRAALVAYQRQRRTLMAFEDNIANDVRTDIRQLRTLAELYRIQQRSVELGYAQVDNAEAILFAPPVPGAGSDAGSAAALTQQVLQAQSGLLNAQNTLYAHWVNYLIARMRLYLDLELMTLDDRGVWSDELFNRTDDATQPTDQPGGERLPAPRPVGRRGGPQLPQQWSENAPIADRR